MHPGSGSTSGGLPFFLPRRLVDFEYLDADSVQDEEYDKIAKPYRKEIDFAFFVVNFGYSKKDYESLTEREKFFIYKAWETKMVSDTTHLRNAFMNAYINANRKKNKKIIPLWKKKKQKADKELVKDNLRIIRETEEKEGKSWVDLIYKINGFKKEVKANV